MLVVGVIATAVMSLGGVAIAQNRLSGGNVQNADNPKVSVTTEIAGQADGAPSTLPFTGADVTLFALIGIAAIGAGMLIVRTSRVRQAS